MDPTTDDAALRRKTAVAVITMGGGCALLLAVLGAGSWWIARATEGGASRATNTELAAPNAALDTAHAAPSTRDAPAAPSLVHPRKAPSSI